MAGLFGVQAAKGAHILMTRAEITARCLARCEMIAGLKRQNLSDAEIAKQLGVTEGRVWQLLKRGGYNGTRRVAKKRKDGTRVGECP